MHVNRRRSRADGRAAQAARLGRISACCRCSTWRWRCWSRRWSSRSGREPAAGGRDAGLRRLRLWRGDRLHALLRDQLDLHRAGGGGSLPCRPVQHRRRGPGLSGRARRSGWWRSIWAGCRWHRRVPLAIAGRRACSAAPGGFIPGWLQARRGSHVVITTIMLNFVAVGADDLSDGQRADQAGPAARRRASPSPETVWMPSLHGLLGLLGFDLGYAPVNLSLVLALLCCVARVAVRLAHPARLRAARGRPERAAPPSMAASRPPPDHPGHDHLGRARRADGHQRDPGRRSTG